MQSESNPLIQKTINESIIDPHKTPYKTPLKTPSDFTPVLTNRLTLNLFLMQRYRFLTIDQFTRNANLYRSRSADKLRLFEKLKLLEHFGNTKLSGHGKTPKA